MTTTLHVVATMDVEIPTSQSHRSASGPPDAESGGRWSQAFADVVGSFGLPVTYFVHPEVVTEQGFLYKELEERGHCLGLHLHAWRFDNRYRCEFGGLNESQAREMLTRACNSWRSVFGVDPVYFRPGTMSANDATFRVLSDLGFRGGSLSLPGRVFPDKHAVWMGAPLDPHRAHPDFRMIDGPLDFANMPVSVDTSELIAKDGRYFYYDLRPDFTDIDHASMVRRILGQIVERKPRVPCINLLTHNDHDFSNQSSAVTRNLLVTLKAIESAAAEYGLSYQGSTLADISDAVLALPPRETTFDPSGGRVLFDEDDRPPATGP